MNPRIIFKTATISTGQALSQELDLLNGASDTKHLSIIGVIVPATWTAADIAFQVTDTAGGTYQAVYDSTNTLLEITVTAGRTYALNPTITVGFPYVKIWSQSGGSGVNQAADRNVILICRDFS